VSSVGTFPLVLVADDDPVMRAVVHAWLTQAEYEVILAEDGDAALALAIEHDPDLLLIDVSMPGLDGFEVCRALLKAVPTPPPVIFLTAHGDTQSRVAGLDAGAVDYVVKPLVCDELVARVRAALRTKAVRDDLIKHAGLDPLTGVLNRRELDARARVAIAHAERYDRALTCAMLDIDHFKAINDRYGHAAGDAVLREAATRISESCRASDTIGRYGGEEFVVLLPETRVEDAAVLAERLRCRFDDHGLTFEGTTVHVTVSIGVAPWEPGVTVPASLYSAADRALYTAKDLGRNRIELVAPS
jgi:diguanylate cyclase (GGDEF)-like protein